MSPAQNPHTPHHAITLHYRITSLHYTIALRHCITPLRHNTRSTRSTAYTLGRRYKPISSPNSSARHPWATLQAKNVPQQNSTAPSGNTSPLFRRRNIRIDPVMNKPGDTFGTAYTLGRRFKPTSFHNRAMRHSRATLQPQNVPQQFCAAPSGNTLSLFRRRNVRIDPVSNKLGDTFGTPWATIQAHIATPTEPHRTFGRHYYVPERVVDDGAAGCNCSPKKG